MASIEEEERIGDRRGLDKNDGNINLDLLPKLWECFLSDKTKVEKGVERPSSRLAFRALLGGKKTGDVVKERGEDERSKKHNEMDSTLSMKINVESFRFITY